MKSNVLNKIILVLLVTVSTLLIMTIKSNAATSISISTSKSSVAPGETFTVTVSAVGAGQVTTSVSNGSGGKSDFLDNSSYSFTCTAGSSGSVTITASGLLGDYETNGESNRSASKTVKIVQPTSNTGESSGGSSGGSSAGTSGGSSSGGNSGGATTNTPKEVEKSKINTLSGLSVAEGTITPEFNKDIREYSLNIPYETSSVNVTATPTDSKATVDVAGNTDLKEGENTVTVTVTAEDGSTSKYLIRVIRARVPLALKSLIVKYTNENGELIEIPLNPKFSFDTLEYTLEDLEYWVEKLSIEAIANIEGATIDIQGADNLSTGENIIIIALNIKEGEGEELKEETISYTIKVNKKEEPTILAKISNWFKGIFGGVSSWYNDNQEQVILGALGICIIALLGLSICIIVDYNKYKDVITKVKKVNEINANQNIAEEIYQKNNTEISEVLEKKSDNNDNAKGGKHF